MGSIPSYRVMVGGTVTLADTCSGIVKLATNLEVI